MSMTRWCVPLAVFATMTIAAAPAWAQQQQKQKPNILVIMGDDIGYWNISAYKRGQMGYRTPNIDRIANEGAIFTDYYGQQSCTAGRAAFTTGQSPLRTGLLKVGLPGAKEGLSEKDPTIAELLKPQGYVTGQFGKNHLGDRNEFLPTVHGFDVFFGNLYHLNAEDEPEHPDYPKNPAFRAQFGPRGVLKCVATSTDTPGDDPRFGPWGKQNCEDTGPLTKKRMETIDEEFLKATTEFIDGAVRDRKPFFVWFNSTRMHIWTRLKPASQGVTGLGIYPDGMVEHDGQVGQLLKKLDDLGIANNTIVIYTTDNGAEAFSWPDGGTTPFRGEKNTNWELPRAGVGALARLGAAAHRDQRYLLGRGLGNDAGRSGRRAGHQEQAAAGLRRRRQDLPGSPRRLRPAGPARPHGPKQAPRVLLLDR
jgi:arylsulfatase A-like enzyme